MENIKSNENITDITEVIENSFRGWFSRMDVSEYKWKLVSDNQNEPTQVHFYKEDTNDTLSVSLSTLFDRCLKEYKHHLDGFEAKEKRRVEEEIREKKDKLLEDKVNEVIESYELFLKQQVKDEIIQQDIKPNLTNIRKMLDYFSKDDDDRNGIHYGDGNRRMNNIFIQKEWYLENYEKLTQIVLSIDPEHKPTNEKYSKNDYGTRFMCLEDMNPNKNYSYSGERIKYKFYEKLDLLLRKMKKSKIGYWYSK